MKIIVDILNNDIKEIHSINQGIQDYIDICNSESERRAAYLEQNTAHL